VATDDEGNTQATGHLAITVQITDNLETEIFAQGLSIYPNPTVNNDLFIEVKNNDWKNFKVLNSNGKVITSGCLNFGINRIDARMLSEGFYLVEIKSAEEKHTVKIIKNE
jgi:hypothetical protein